MNAFAGLLLFVCLTAQAASPAPALPALPDPSALRLPGAGEPPERLVWTKTPIPIALHVGRERIVSFPVPVRVGLPPELGADRLRTQIVNGTIYWVAQQEFTNKRVEVQATASGNVYLLDLSAIKSADKSASSNPPIEISVPETSPAQALALPGTSQKPATPAPPPPPKEQDYVTLVRMAAQHLYAPARLHRMPDGVYSVPVARSGTDMLIRGGVVDASPVSAWRSGSLYVTAVKLRNRTFGDVVLDPRRMRGRWLACAFQHSGLSARGDLRDTTAVYLISTKPYEESLNGR